MTITEERNPWRDMEAVQNILLGRIQELERDQRRLKWWLLVETLLLLSVTIIVLVPR